MAIKLRLTDTKTERKIKNLENQIIYLERNVTAKQRQIIKQIEHFMELEEKYKKATKRAHGLQLKVNSLEKQLGNVDEYDTARTN